MTWKGRKPACRPCREMCVSKVYGGKGGPERAGWGLQECGCSNPSPPARYLSGGVQRCQGWGAEGVVLAGGKVGPGSQTCPFIPVGLCCPHRTMRECLVVCQRYNHLLRPVPFPPHISTCHRKDSAPLVPPGGPHTSSQVHSRWHRIPFLTRTSASTLDGQQVLAHPCSLLAALSLSLPLRP